MFVVLNEPGLIPVLECLPEMEVSSEESSQGIKFPEA